MKKVLIFIGGVFTGFCVAYKVLEKKFEQKINESVAEVVRSYNKQFDSIVGKKVDVKKESEENIETVEDPEEKKNRDMYEDLSIIYRNSQERVPYNKPHEIVSDDIDIIHADEVGEIYDYTTINLTLYGDGIVADDMDEIIDDWRCIGGKEMLKNMGIYENDALYLRNNSRKSYYTIVNTSVKFSDLYNA